jgi:diadenosine tetraphosphate (Ap4A) HIT family hydrolase
MRKTSGESPLKKAFAAAVLCITGFLALIYFFNYEWVPDRSLPYILDHGPCPFCTEEIYTEQSIMEGDKTSVILNFRPVAEQHILIMPTRHVERFEELQGEEVAAMFADIAFMQRVFEKDYGKRDYVLIVQNGYYGGQTVNHTHIHMIPRGTESTLMKKVQLWWLTLTDFIGTREKLSPEELKERVDQMRHAVKREKERESVQVDTEERENESS